ncbi:MAG: 3-hydroxyacyl-ACP dehydratase FabZ family protein [Verrucomicrobiales bacterium]
MAFEESLKLLPHGPEFRFIDKVVSLIPGKHGRGHYTVRGDEPFLAGHFPAQPLFPGVLLVEAGAQMAGLTAQSDPEIPPLKGLKLTAMRVVKILGTALPGETFEVEATVSGRLGNLIQAEVKATCGERLLLQAAITLSGDQP